MTPDAGSVDRSVEGLRSVLASRVDALSVTAHEPGRGTRGARVTALPAASAPLPPRPLESLVGGVFADVRVQADHACQVLPGHASYAIPLAAPGTSCGRRLSRLRSSVARRVASTPADLAGRSSPGAGQVADALGTRLQRVAA